jgi:hypothetical protein
VDRSPIDDHNIRKQVRDAGGTYWSNRHAIALLDEPNGQTPEDAMVHLMTHMLLAPVVNDRADGWLDEGMALWFTTKLVNTHRWACGGFVTTTDGSDGEYDAEDATFSATDNWRPLLKSAVIARKFPKAKLMFNSSHNGLTAKMSAMSCAWVDYLIAARRAELTKLIACVAASTPQKGNEVCLKEVTGLDGDGWDKAWTEWVKKTY